jgi:hypothetical protein
MSEVIGLGRSDARDTWFTLVRHQVLLVIVGSIACGDWLVRAGSASGELMLGMILMVSALRVVRGLTLAELAQLSVLYLVRSPWQRVTSSRSGDLIEIEAGGTASFQGYELIHRGRLDLSGADFTNAQRLSELMNGLAVGAPLSHVSLHVRARGVIARTFLTLPRDASVCEGWSPSAHLIEHVLDDGAGNSKLIFERWSYLRSSDGLRRIVRIDDFRGATQERALLERLQETSLDLDLALHVEVVGSSRAQRLSARAVHRVGSDAQVARAAGFRRSAQAAMAAERLGQREELVATGQALLRCAVYLTLHCASLAELRDSSSELSRRAVASGLRLDTGVGRQWRWFCFALPGGPGW